MLKKPLGMPVVGIYTSCMKLRKLSIGQKKHLATTARIIGIGAFVLYGLLELALKAIERKQHVMTSHAGIFIVGLGIFLIAELLAVAILQGVDS